MSTLLPLLLTLLAPDAAVEPAPASESIGGYAKGCLLHGVEIPHKGIGFETIRRFRKRYYAHPTSKAFLEGYGARMQAAGLAAVLVGDIAQEGGGKMPSGHSSHQTGLDIDVWFTRPDARKKDKSFESLVKRDETIDATLWTAEHETMLRLAAESPDVARVFVNWVIKKKLCSAAKGKPWLKKVRPWYGHDRHFHIRRACPAGSKDCVNQPTPTSDQCGKESWFSRAAVAKRKKAGKKKRKRARRPLHPRCVKALKAKRKAKRKSKSKPKP